MKKPLLPVSNRWIRQVTLSDPSILFTPDLVEKADAQSINLGESIKVVGIHGNVLVIQFGEGIYLCPSMIVQYLLWSFENNIGHQYSDEEQLAICGTSGLTNIEETLQREISILATKSLVVTGPKSEAMNHLGTVVDNFLNNSHFDEVPHYLFDDGRRG